MSRKRLGRMNLIRIGQNLDLKDNPIMIGFTLRFGGVPPLKGRRSYFEHLHLQIVQVDFFGCFDGHHVTVCWHRRTAPFTVGRCQ